MNWSIDLSYHVFKLSDIRMPPSFVKSPSTLGRRSPAPSRKTRCYTRKDTIIVNYIRSYQHPQSKFQLTKYLCTFKASISIISISSTTFTYFFFSSMASEGKYNHETSIPSNFWTRDQWFIAITAMVLSLIMGYLVYDAVMSTAVEMLQSLLMISPLILVIVVHWLSAPNRFSIPVPGSEPNAIHQAGGSPWGITLILALLFFLISHQPSLRGFLF